MSATKDNAPYDGNQFVSEKPEIVAYHKTDFDIKIFILQREIDCLRNSKKILEELVRVQSEHWQNLSKENHLLRQKLFDRNKKL